MKRSTGFLLGCLAASLAFSPVALPQWDQYTVTVIDLHPEGASDSQAGAIADGHVVGIATVANRSHASLWTAATAGSWVDLHPAGLGGETFAYATSGDQQAGEAAGQAALWSGTADSWVNLHPPGVAGRSVVYATTGNQQVGVVNGRAALWAGTPESLVNLHPAGALSSAAYALSNDRQGGRITIRVVKEEPDPYDDDVTEHAGIWSGTAGSWIDLHPGPTDTYSGSAIFAMTDTKQGGYTYTYISDAGFWSRAAIWSGTVSSWIDLTPHSWEDSAVVDMTGELQAGYAGDSEGYSERAGLWAGTRESWFDLQSALELRREPRVSWHRSRANGIWEDGGALYVVGSARRVEESGPGRYVTAHHALLWKLSPSSETGPALSEIPSQITFAGKPILDLAFTVTDPDTPLDELEFDVDSSDFGVVFPPQSGVVLKGSGPNRTLDIFTTGSGVGETLLRLRVSDGTTMASRSFRVTVLHSAPTISSIPSQTTPEDTPIMGVPFTVSDPDTPLESLTFSVSSSVPTLIAPSGVVVNGHGADRTLDITPEPNRFGETSITLRVSDGTSTAATTFRVTVVGGGPALSAIGRQEALQGTLLVEVPFTVSDPNTPLDDLSFSVASSNPALVPHSGLVLRGTGAARSLEITSDPNEYGETTITLSASDGDRTASRVFKLALVRNTMVIGPYTVTATCLRPARSKQSSGGSVWGDQQVGVADGNAGIWSGTADSWVDLQPGGASASSANATNGRQQAGSADFGALHAGIWSGTADSWVDLHPVGARYSEARATTGSQQAGFACFDDGWHAGIWSGTAASWVDLHPVGAWQSEIWGTDGSRQVGEVNDRAAIWSGSADAWVDLNPDGALYSVARAIGGGLQVGGAIFETLVDWPGDPWYAEVWRAGTWSGTADSWVDLHPAEAWESWAVATTGRHQAGSATVTRTHAGIWEGTGASWLDLHRSLQNVYLESWATGIWYEGNTILVIGGAVGNTAADAILWTLMRDPGSAPQVSWIPPEVTSINTPILGLAFTVSDPDTPLADLVFTVESSNARLIPPSGVAVNGTGANRTLDITPEPGQHGEALITLTVSDGHQTASTTFQVTVMAQASVVHVLTGANFSANPGFSVVRNDLLNPALFGPSGTVPHSINLVTTESITADSLEGIEVVILQVTFGPMPAVEDLSALTQFVNAGGGLFVFGNEIDQFASMVGATPSPGWGLGSTATVVDTASPLVTGPFGSLPLGPLFSLCMHDAFASAGPEGLVGITDGGGPFGITYQLGAGRVALVGDEEVFLSSYPGTGACIGLRPSSRLIFRNAMAYVIPTGTAGTGPQISEIPPQTTLEDTPILDVPVTVSDPDTPLDELTFSALSSNPTLIAPSGVVVKGTGANRTLDITPEPDQFGEALITLGVSDGTTSASRSFKVTVASVNDGPPVPGPDTVERRAGANVKVAVSRLLANDTDPDLDPLSLTAVASLSEKQAAVSLSGDWVLYVPPPGLNEPDTFTYTVSDGHGGEATGTVTVLITDDPAGPSLNQLALDVTRDPDTGEITSLTLTFVGIPGRLYALERAATLAAPVTWTCLQTQTAGPTGLMAFTDSQPLAGEAYYRTAERTTPCP
ncbi:MAG: tandem-95 repeat protein [Verrucomicrobiales bacterium]|nr:tandem-95 repeat protein [Verrucomicrobiales bacterium]